MSDEPIRTICLEMSKTEAHLLLLSLRILKNTVRDDIIDSPTQEKMNDFALILAMIGRIGVTCFEVGLLEGESMFDLQMWLELRKDLENETETDGTS